MEELKDKRAYSEVIEILNHIPKEDYAKIPTEYIKFFEKEKDKNYYFIYDASQTLEAQSVSKEAKIIIAILFRDYWATPHQKNIILENERNYRKRIEERKKEKNNYNINFNTTNNEDVLNRTGQELTIVKKEKWYEKIINILRNLFVKR